MYRLIFSLLISVYFSVFVSVLLHELFHCATLLVLRIPIEGLYIGNKFLRIKVCKFHFSPIVFGGYVDANEDYLLRASVQKIIFFYMSGVLGNLVVIAFCLTYISNFIGSYIIASNICYIIACLVPFISEKNDISAMFRTLKDKKQLSKIQQ